MILMISSLLAIHNHDRMSSITRVLHTTTWFYFTSRLPVRFFNSPKEVKEAIMTDINDLVQEFWRTPNDGAVGTSFFAMRRLFEILQWYFICVFFYIISVLRLTLNWLIKSHRQTPQKNNRILALFCSVEPWQQ